ncbi:glycosyltransferase family 2 protein [Alteromonas sp. BMJM2]|uniref:glycosyltransferase family 2 protein n=1 Tax=Alteromonas sp. BMJM2 TaxID=2954241 RepID=UPI0022B4C83C|nr:glycosyltransferase family 2 protein [Alteromonas sp. BMJM2]
MMLPKVTVVTVCFNALSDLKKTYDSVKNLTYKNLEYIIVDGGSTDSTVEFLKTLPENVKWLSEPDNGIYYAMNKGIELATGEWIIFMNAADVFYANDILAKVMSHASSEVDFLYGDRIRVETNGSEALQNAGKLDDYLKTEVVFHQALFNRTSRLKKRPYNTHYSLAADYEYIVQAIHSGASLRYVSIPICKFQCGGRSRVLHVRGMTEAMKISIDFQKDKSLWTESDFFKGFIGNHLEAELNRVITDYIDGQGSFGGTFFNDSKGNLRIKLNKSNDTFHRFLGRVLRPLSRLALSTTPQRDESIKFAKEKTFTPKISIVTVVYNDLNGMKRTFESVSTLDYVNIEYIVIDGNSSDGTIDFLQANSCKIDVLVSENDDGIYDAMNKAIDRSSGDYVIFMNAGDCFTTPDVVGKAFEESDISNDVIYGDRNYLAADGTISHQKAKEMSTVFERMPYCHQSVFVKSSVLRKFKFELAYKYAADYHQVVKMYLSNIKFKKIDLTISNFEAGGRSESGIRPYLEVIKIQLDNAPKGFKSQNSVYIKSFINNFGDLTRDL